MSLFTPSAPLLAVGQCAVGLLRAKQPVNATEIAEFDAGDSTSLQGALRSVLEKGGTAALDVVLSDDVVKLFVVDPPAGLTRFSDLEAVATVRFEELFGLEAAEWRISADWHAQRRFMASAAPRWLLAALDDRSRKVVCIEPAFVRSCNALAREPFAVACLPVSGLPDSGELRRCHMPASAIRCAGTRSAVGAMAPA